MAYNPRINIWYQKYLAEANAAQDAENDQALLNQQREESTGSSPYADQTDNSVGWQDANTRIPFGIGTMAAITKNLMHKSGANYTGDTQAVMDAVAKWGPSALNKTAGTTFGPKRYAWENQIDPIKTQGYIAQLTAAVQNLPSLQNEWTTATSNPQTIQSTMGDNSGGGMLMDDEDGQFGHLFD
jgi:hypothetical protein